MKLKFKLLCHWLTIVAFAVMALIPVNAAATTYYVSASTGNDSNNGTSEKTPWKTLGKVSGIEFKPGDTILLKRGDVWAESLLPKGSGLSTNWITLSAYGSGNRPKIAPQGNPLWGIYLENCAGWKITGLEVSNVQAGIRLLISALGIYDGFWVEDCYVHHIENAPLYPNQVEPGLFMSYGISTYKVLGKGLPALTNVTLKNCVIENTDAPVTISSVDNLTLEGLKINNSYREGVLFGLINENGNIGIMKDCVILNTGYPKGMYWGVAGMQFNSTRNFVMENCEVAYTKAPGCPDGCGVDFEGNNVNVTVKNSYIHDNEGPAFLVYKNPKWGLDNINTSIIGNRIEYNGLKDVKTEMSFLKHKFNRENGGTIVGNKIIKFKGQPLNLVDSLDPQLTEKMPPSYQVSGNTVTERELGEYANYKKSEPPVNFKPAKTWEFNKKGDFEGWTTETRLNAIDNGVVAGGKFNADIVAKDPYITSADNLGIDLDVNKVVKIRYRNGTVRTDARIYFTTDSDGSWSETKARSARVVGGNDEYGEYFIDMSYVQTWKGKLKQLRFDPIDNVDGVTGTFSIDYIAIGKDLDAKPAQIQSQPQQAPVIVAVNVPTLPAGKKFNSTIKWDFTKNNDFEGWSTATRYNAINDAKVTNNYLTASIVAKNPYITSKKDLDIPLDNNKYMVVKFKNATNGSVAKIYFTTEADPKFDEGKCKRISTKSNDSEYTEYLFDMTAVTGWTGTLKQLRFDPVENKEGISGTFSIDYIGIGSVKL